MKKTNETVETTSLGQWIEHPPGVREVMGSSPVEELEFFFVPRSCHVGQFTFHISLPSLKFTIFIHLSLLLLTVLPFDVEIGGVCFDSPKVHLTFESALYNK